MFEGNPCIEEMLISASGKNKAQMFSAIKKIGVIYTGGTIGMDMAESGLVASGNFIEKFKSHIGFFQNSCFQFEFIEYATPIDSAHAELGLAFSIYQNIMTLREKVDAFIVLIGSDTLAYMAASLAFLTHNDPLPIIVTGAMIPLTQPGSDGVGNIHQAIELLALDKIENVQVVFGNKLIPAVRCTKLFAHTSQAMFDTRSPGLTLAKSYALSLAKPLTCYDFVSRDVRLLRAMPGLHDEFSTRVLEGKPEAVIIQCYGSGTVPRDDSGFADALEKATSRGVPVFSISQSMCTYVDYSTYAASAWLDRLGVVRCGDMNLEATYTKLWYLLNLGFTGKQLKTYMQWNLCGEISELPLSKPSQS